VVSREKKLQRDFFDQRPAQISWQSLLVEKGFLRLVKPREKKHFDLIKKLKIKPYDKVLDVGCGTGHFLARLEKEFGIKGTGIDFSSNSIKLAKKREKKNLKFFITEAEELGFKNKSFDYVFCFDVLEHIENQNKALQEMVRVLKPKARLLIYTINKRRRFTWDWCLEKLGFPLAKWTAHYKKVLFSEPEDLINKLKKLGMKKEQLTFYDSFFCLGLNELMTLFGNLMIKLKLDKNRFLGRIVLWFTTGVSKSLGQVFDWLDWPWKINGVSNSFYLLVKKNN